MNIEIYKMKMKKKIAHHLHIYILREKHTRTHIYSKYI